VRRGNIDAFSGSARQGIRHVCKISHIASETRQVRPGDTQEKVIPTLRKQKGFRDEISFYDKDSNESIAISFWDTEADVRKYEKDIYPEMVKSLSETFEEAPKVKHFEVANATFYKIHAS
jgi:heme-degrading monooxygenase HmoA